MVLCHVFCHMQMLKRLLKGHVTEWAREGGWGGVRDEYDAIRHYAIRGPGGMGERVGVEWKKGLTAPHRSLYSNYVACELPGLSHKFPPCA